MKGISS